MILLIFALVASLLGDHAQAHADLLAATGGRHHSDLSPLSADYGGPCDWAGETIYRGADPDHRWAMYQNSPAHAAVVDFPWTHHGVGTARMADGRWVVVDVFCVATPEPDPSPDNRARPRAVSVPPAPTSEIEELTIRVHPTDRIAHFDFEALEELLAVAGLEIV